MNDQQVKWLPNRGNDKIGDGFCIGRFSIENSPSRKLYDISCKWKYQARPPIEIEQQKLKHLVVRM